jgi:hypothetical protein
MIHRKYQPSSSGQMMEAGDYNLIPSLNNLYSPHPPHPKKNDNKEVNEI